MSFEKELIARSNSKCELCNSTEGLNVFEVSPTSNKSGDDFIFICKTCSDQLNKITPMNSNHWRCLNDSMWSEVKAVQVIAWRVLNEIKSEGWPNDLLEMLYLDDETLSRAKAGIQEEGEVAIVHKDSNGAVLTAGDTVILIKDLDVKGANFTAKRGTAVRGITLVHDNANQIEGKVNGQHIVILTQFVKK